MKTPFGAFAAAGWLAGSAWLLALAPALTPANTPEQLARGAQGTRGWSVGFNLTRKFIREGGW